MPPSAGALFSIASFGIAYSIRGTALDPRATRISIESMPARAVGIRPTTRSERLPRLFQRGSFSENVAGNLAGAAVLAAAATVWASLGLPWPLPWWLWAIVTAVAVVVALTARLVFRLYYRWKVSEWSGIVRVYPVRGFAAQEEQPNAKHREAAERALQELTRNANRLQLLLASGFHYIGSHKSPGVLYEALNARSGPFQLDVLLLDPGSKDEVAKRAKLANMDEHQYRAGMDSVLWTLRQLKEARGVNVSVRTYKEAPIWQMVLTDAELWLLCAHSIASDLSPVYCLKHAPYGLSHGLRAVWTRREEGGTPVDLLTVNQPKWPDVVRVKSK